MRSQPRGNACVRFRARSSRRCRRRSSPMRTSSCHCSSTRPNPRRRRRSAPAARSVALCTLETRWRCCRMLLALRACDHGLRGMACRALRALLRQAVALRPVIVERVALCCSGHGIQPRGPRERAEGLPRPLPADEPRPSLASVVGPQSRRWIGLGRVTRRQPVSHATPAMPCRHVLGLLARALSRYPSLANRTVGALRCMPKKL